MNEKGIRIRNAFPNDDIYVAELLIQAMGKLASFFTSGADHLVQVSLFRHFFLLTNNQYSFENTIVFEEDGIILGSSNGYDGSRLHELREKFFSYILNKYSVRFPPSIDETEGGEFYIDCVSVFDKYQGKGVGKLLIMAMLEKGKLLGLKKAGLLVDENNVKAKRLYEDIGFSIVDEKIFMNDLYYHMQIEI